MPNHEKRIHESSAYRAKMVAELFQEHYVRGRSMVSIWRDEIYPVYRISFRTLQRYLERNAKRELRLLEEQRAAADENE